MPKIKYKIVEEEIYAGPILECCLGCSKANECMMLHEQLSLFYTLDIDEVTEIFGSTELKRKKKLSRRGTVTPKFQRREKYMDHSWDYTRIDTKTYTHCFHNYPAMMIPQITECI